MCGRRGAGDQEAAELFGGAGAEEERVCVGDGVHLGCDGLLDARVAVADASDGGTACRVENGLAIGEVEVRALSADDGQWIRVERAMEDGGLVVGFVRGILIGGSEGFGHNYISIIENGLRRHFQSMIKLG